MAMKLKGSTGGLEIWYDQTLQTARVVAASGNHEVNRVTVCLFASQGECAEREAEWVFNRLVNALRTAHEELKVHEKSTERLTCTAVRAGARCTKPKGHKDRHQAGFAFWT